MATLKDVEKARDSVTVFCAPQIDYISSFYEATKRIAELEEQISSLKEEIIRLEWRLLGK